VNLIVGVSDQRLKLREAGTVPDHEKAGDGVSDLDRVNVTKMGDARPLQSCPPIWFALKALPNVLLEDSLAEARVGGLRAAVEQVLDQAADPLWIFSFGHSIRVRPSRLVVPQKRLLPVRVGVFDIHQQRREGAPVFHPTTVRTLRAESSEATECPLLP
jgi:hypothetical protein